MTLSLGKHASVFLEGIHFKTLKSFPLRYPTTSFHFNQVGAHQEALLLIAPIQERIFSLYNTDQEEVPVTSPVVRRLRKSGIEGAEVKPDKRTTLFFAD